MHGPNWSSILDNKEQSLTIMLEQKKCMYGGDIPCYES